MSNNKKLGRPTVPTSLKRKGRMVSMNDYEHERAETISSNNGRTFSEQVRLFFEQEEEKMLSGGPKVETVTVSKGDKVLGSYKNG